MKILIHLIILCSRIDSNASSGWPTLQRKDLKDNNLFISNSLGSLIMAKKGWTLRAFYRKGYFFIIDALIGSTIIFLSLMIILGSSTRPAKVQYNYEMAEEYTTFIMNTKIQDLNDKYISDLVKNNIINNTQLSVMEQVDTFYHDNDMTHAHDLVKNLTEPLVMSKYGFSYSIIDKGVKTNIYSRTVPDINQAKIVIASKKITFLQINSTSVFGPAMVEIKIWI